jgi:hypothetical protein
MIGLSRHPNHAWLNGILVLGKHGPLPLHPFSRLEVSDAIGIRKGRERYGGILEESVKKNRNVLADH